MGGPPESSEKDPLPAGGVTLIVPTGKNPQTADETVVVEVDVVVEVEVPAEVVVVDGEVVVLVEVDVLVVGEMLVEVVLDVEAAVVVLVLATVVVGIDVVEPGTVDVDRTVEVVGGCDTAGNESDVNGLVPPQSFWVLQHSSSTPVPIVAQSSCVTRRTR